VSRVPRALRRLAFALDGGLPGDEEWFGLIEIANKGWLGPALYLALERSGSLGQVPDEARNYLALLHDSNRQRNLRLKGQLAEAVRALNAKGVEPIAMKGAVNLLTCADEGVGERMISDLDISIQPSELARSREALLALGYANAPTYRELARPEDVGLLELHMKPSGRSSRYLSGDLQSSSRPVEMDGGVALVPSATARALHLVVHDMIKEGDYWRLRLDLRHLKDLADLAHSQEGVDWGQLVTVLDDPTARRALRVQMQMLRDVFGIEAGESGFDTAAERILHSARLSAMGEGPVGGALRAAGNLWWGVHWVFHSHSWRGFRHLAARMRTLFVEPAKGSRV
jgi:hypothetical protein